MLIKKMAFILGVCLLMCVVLECFSIENEDTASAIDEQKAVVVQKTGLEPSVVDEIYTQSKKYGLSPELILALIEKESDFKVDALSPKGAMGLGQVMPGTGRWAAKQLGLKDYSKDQLFDPIINVKITSYYLTRLLNQYSWDYHKALTAYNMGSPRMEDYVSRHGNAETRYSDKILIAEKEIKEQVIGAE